jgi:CYTH domain-containing protein
LKWNGYQIELDVYQGTLAGLVAAEIEFESAEESKRFSPPAWFGEEVTEDHHYKNSSLALNGGCFRRLTIDCCSIIRSGAEQSCRGVRGIFLP